MTIKTIMTEAVVGSSMTTRLSLVVSFCVPSLFFVQIYLLYALLNNNTEFIHSFNVLDQCSD